MYNSAIVGAGAISAVHCEAIKNIPNARLTALCDIKRERAEERALKYGGNVYTDFDTMLDNEKIDVLHICTPHYLHVPMAISALEKGINVILEKPPAITKEEFERLEKVSKNTSARLGICFQNRYNESVREVKKLLSCGKCGKVMGARAFVTWNRTADYYKSSGWRGDIKTEGGGVLINQAIHTLDLITYLLGEPVSVSAHTSNNHLKGVINVEDTVSAYISYPDFNVLFFATTAYCKDAPNILEIVCENCVIRIEGKKLTVSHNDGKTDVYDYSTITTVGKQCWGASHAHLILDYYECLAENRQFPVSLESARPSFEALTAIYDSAKSGTEITVTK